MWAGPVGSSLSRPQPISPARTGPVHHHELSPRRGARRDPARDRQANRKPAEDARFGCMLGQPRPTSSLAATARSTARPPFARATRLRPPAAGPSTATRSPRRARVRRPPSLAFGVVRRVGRQAGNAAGRDRERTRRRASARRVKGCVTGRRRVRPASMGRHSLSRRVTTSCPWVDARVAGRPAPGRRRTVTSTVQSRRRMTNPNGVRSDWI